MTTTTTRKSLLFCIGLFVTFHLLSMLRVDAAVANALSLQGSLLADGSSDLISATPMSILWTEKSSIDPTVFDHALAEPTKLVVRQDGDYLVAATVPFISINTVDNRPSQVIEVYVNGTAVPGTVGRLRIFAISLGTRTCIRNLPITCTRC